jgi:hypothetical protein
VLAPGGGRPSPGDQSDLVTEPGEGVLVVADEVLVVAAVALL